MNSEVADFFEFRSLNETGAETGKTAGGGGAGKSSVGGLSFTKYIDTTGGIDDLCAPAGDAPVMIGLLLPAVQAFHAGSVTPVDAASDEQLTFTFVEAWDDWSLG